MVQGKNKKSKNEENLMEEGFERNPWRVKRKVWKQEGEERRQWLASWSSTTLMMMWDWRLDYLVWFMMHRHWWPSLWFMTLQWREKSKIFIFMKNLSLLFRLGLGLVHWRKFIFLPFQFYLRTPNFFNTKTFLLIFFIKIFPLVRKIQ